MTRLDSSHLQEITQLDTGDLRLECYHSRFESRFDWSTGNKITCMKKIFCLGKFDFLKIAP